MLRLRRSASIVSPQRVEHLEAQLRRLKYPVFPELSVQKLKIPQPLAPKRLQSYPRPSLADLAMVVLVGSGAVCLAAPVSLCVSRRNAGLARERGARPASKVAKENRREHDQLAKELADEQNTLQRKGAGDHGSSREAAGFLRRIDRGIEGRSLRTIAPPTINLRTCLPSFG